MFRLSRQIHKAETCQTGEQVAGLRSRTERPQYAHTRTHPVAAPAAQHQHLDSRLPFGQGRFLLRLTGDVGSGVFECDQLAAGCGERRGLLSALGVLLTSS